ncbi:MAG: zinc ribbon domain-containing protein [Polyangiaceae bacterium]
MTYEYACEACGHTWEAEQSIRDEPLTECPNCKGATAKRMVSGGQGFILKGGGWYADGYGSAKPGSKKSGESSSTSSTSTTSSTSDSATTSSKSDSAGDGGASSSTTSGTSGGSGTKS